MIRCKKCRRPAEVVVLAHSDMVELICDSCERQMSVPNSDLYQILKAAWSLFEFKKRISVIENPHFAIELLELINKYSLEDGSDTPDHILADYIIDSINAFNQATVSRNHWHGPLKGD